MTPYYLQHFYSLLLDIVMKKFGQEVVDELELDRGLRFRYRPELSKK